MGDGMLHLYRSPLREGESVYTLGGIDQGAFSEGVHKGEKKPKLQSMFPEVMDDGRLCWRILDSEENRTLCQGLLPTLENPPFAYSVGEAPVTPEEGAGAFHAAIHEEAVKRGRPKKDAK